METSKNKKMGNKKYQENWKYGKCEKYVIEKYQEHWKYGNSEKYRIGNMKNVKADNRKEGKVKTRKGIQWNKYYY